MIRTDLFTVSAEQIERLDAGGLVDLMRRLLYAEARATGLPLSGIHVPAQITVPDGGEDGRMVWEGGAERTPYLPRRHTALQAKATTVTAASLRAETQVPTAKDRRKAKTQSPILRPVLAEAIAAAGAYIVVTTKSLNPKQKAPLLRALRDGILATGHDPAALALDIYDANKLAAWATHHQAVALALNEKLGGHSLSGFKSLDLWGRHPDIHAVPWSDDDQPRFVLAPPILPPTERKDRSRNAWTFVQARRSILDHIAEPGRAVRVHGASGLGKSRLAHALFKRQLLADAIQAAAVIYADYTVVADAAVQLAHRFADTGADVVLIVDECPDRVHQRLMEAVGQQGSLLRLISIDVENRQVASATVLTVEVEAAGGSLIETLIGAVDAKLDAAVKSYIRDVAQGYPRMAVHGVRAAREGSNPIRSAAELIDRIVWGRRSPDAEAMRALEVASLFDALRIKGEAPTDLAAIAAPLAEMSEPRMREHLLSFAERGIVTEKGRYIQVQPIPLAAHLGRRRIAALGAAGVAAFFADAPEHLRSRLLDRLKWLDTAEEAQAFAVDLLTADGIGTFAALNTEFGSRCFDRLAHVVPDVAMDTLDRAFGPCSKDDLKRFEDGRRHIVWALARLVFRRQTFERAARLLLRLATAETELHIGNSATGEFKRLFQLHLSGTEAAPAERLIVLDEGLASNDPVTHGIAIDAAGIMLDTGHFSRSGGAEVIGSQAPLQDWRPATWNDVWDFHMAGLERLAAFAVGPTPQATVAQGLIGTHLHGLLSAVPFDRLEPTCKTIASHVGVWPQAIHSVSNWLFLDRRKLNNANLSSKVRALYDTLMPTDVVDQAILFAGGSTTDIHDPDQEYDDRPNARNDLYYADRTVQRLGEEVARGNPSQLQRCLTAGMTMTLRSGFGLGKALAQALPDPQSAFQYMIECADRHGSLPDDRFMRGFLHGLDARDSALARAAVDGALASPVVGRNATALMMGLVLEASDVPRLVTLLHQGRIQPDWCAQLSYGRGFDRISHDELAPFLDALIDSGPAGAWSALQIISLVLHEQQALPPVLAERIRRILFLDGLFAASSRQTRDAHLINSELGRLAAHGGVDGPFVQSFVRRLLSIPALDHRQRFDFERYAYEMLTCLIAKAPEAVWSEIAPKLDGTAGIEHWKLERLFAPDRDDRSGPGVLVQLPARLYLDWARQSPDARAPTVAEWLPLTVKNENGQRTWHPSLEAFIDEFASINGVLPTIGSRMRPGGWSGSLVPYLEPWLPLVDQWRIHRNDHVRRWAQAAHKGLLDQIAAEHQGDAERDVGVW